MIHIEAIPGTLLPPHARQRAIHAVAKPIQHEAHNHEKQKVTVVSRQCIADAGSHLCAQTECRELIRTEPTRRTLRHPLQSALLQSSCQRLVDPASRSKLNVS